MIGFILPSLREDKKCTKKSRKCGNSCVSKARTKRCAGDKKGGGSSSSKRSAKASGKTATKGRKKTDITNKVHTFYSRDGDTSAQIFPEASKSGRGTIKMSTRVRGSVRVGKGAEQAFTKGFREIAKRLPDGQRVSVTTDDPAAIAVLDKSGLKRAAGRYANSYRGSVSGGKFIRPGQKAGEMAISRRQIEGLSSTQALGNMYRNMAGGRVSRGFKGLPMEKQRSILAQASKRDTRAGMKKAIERATTLAVQKMNSRPYTNTARNRKF